MTDDEQALFHELIAAAQKLTAVCTTASSVLSEEFEDMVGGPNQEVKAVLLKCPNPSIVWDGSLRDEDITTDFIRVEGQTSAEEPRGVKLFHALTGQGVEIYNHPTQAANLAAARKWLEKRVGEIWTSRK